MIKKTINIFFIVERVGPYHNARFNQISKNKELGINVIETNPDSKTSTSLCFQKVHPHKTPIK